MSIRVAGLRTFAGHARTAGLVKADAPAARLRRAAASVLADAENIRAGLLLLAIVAAAGLFKFWLTPTGELGPYSLIQTPNVTAAISHLLATDPAKLLLPYEFEGPGRWLWAPAMLLPQNALYQMLSPLGVYLVLSSLLVVTSFVTSWLAFRSLVFSFTLAFALGFGTQFAYGMTMGFVFGLYLLLSYVCLNLMFAARLVTAPSLRPGLIAAFALSLGVVAVSVEW